MTHQTIINTVNQMAFAADDHEWARCRRSFADEVFVDYTSLAGGEPATMPADALIASWRGLLPGFSSTQHLLGTHLVTIEGDTAHCRANFQATHILDDQSWTLGGRYHFRLQNSESGWQITAITMTALWSVGDQAVLLEQASQRTATAPAS